MNYYIIRVGVIGNEKIKINASNYIDYTNSGLRSGFGDVYLTHTVHFLCARLLEYPACQLYSEDPLFLLIK